MKGHFGPTSLIHLGQWLLNQLYPSYCLNCQKLLSTPQALCSICANELELLSPIGRCSFCFTPNVSCTSHCPFCKIHPIHPRIFGQACCLQESTALQKLIDHLQYHVHWKLEMALASIFYLQHHTLHWPKPDLIITEPGHWLMPNRKSFLVSKRITQHLSALFQVPYAITKFDPTSLSSPELPLEDQMWKEESQASFHYKKTLHGLNILTCSLLIKKGSTWQALASSIDPHGLARIWNMGLIAGTNSWMEAT